MEINVLEKYFDFHTKRSFAKRLGIFLEDKHICSLIYHPIKGDNILARPIKFLKVVPHERENIRDSQE
ncbi:MAG: hypothetical protein DRP25_07440 [Thermotoga sp.]|nr:MAG: hypothetical protein DRP25_07440 [Thermotoga sp.]